MNEHRDVPIDERDELTGYPIDARNDRGAQHIQQDNSVNKALPWVAFSWFLGGGALVGLIVLCMLLPPLIDAKVASGVADARVEMAETIAAARADMHAANTNARLALDRADKTAAQLEARGLIKLENH